MILGVSVPNLCELTFYRGRVALYAMLRGLGIGSGDQVAIQAFTCLAVPEGVMATGATPVYVDVQRHGVNMDPHDLASKITSKTRAIVVQHTYGIPVDLDPIMNVGRPAGLHVIEDCCHTLCSCYRGQRVGTFGAGAFYSFEWGKPLVAGLGGSAVISDPVLLQAVREQYDHFADPTFVASLKVDLQFTTFTLLYGPSSYWFLRDAFRRLSQAGLIEGSYHSTDSTQPALDFGLRMTKHTKQRLARRAASVRHGVEHARWVSSQYRNRLTSGSIMHPLVPHEAEVVYCRYPLFVSSKDDVLKFARRANLELGDWYDGPVHPLPRAKWGLVCYEPGCCPNAEAAGAMVTTLPTHERTTQAFIDRVVCFFSRL